MVCLILLASLAATADFPRTLISEDEAEPIRSAIVRKEAWTADGVRRLRAEAERRMKDGPWTVTYDRPNNPAIDPHDYYSEAPYWWPNPDNPGGPYVRKEGQVYPGRFTANRTALNQMADTVFTLGAASFLLGDPAYARRAARIVHTWFVDPKTRMNSNLKWAQAIPGSSTGQSAGITEGRALLRAIQGMEFLAQSGAWNSKDQEAVRGWFQEYLRWLTTSSAGDEEKASGTYHAAWWTAQVAAVATFVGNSADAHMAFRFYRERIFPRGSREQSHLGPAPLAANLEAFTTICRIAHVQGVNLWALETRRGDTLASAIDTLVPHLSGPKKNKELLASLAPDGPYFLAFAGMGMNQPEYVSLFRKLEHPDNAWLNVIDLLVSRWESSGHQTRH